MAYLPMRKLLSLAPQSWARDNAPPTFSKAFRLPISQSLLSLLFLKARGSDRSGDTFRLMQKGSAALSEIFVLIFLGTSSNRDSFCERSMVRAGLIVAIVFLAIPVFEYRYVRGIRQISSARVHDMDYLNAELVKPHGAFRNNVVVRECSPNKISRRVLLNRDQVIQLKIVIPGSAEFRPNVEIYCWFVGRIVKTVRQILIREFVSDLHLSAYGWSRASVGTLERKEVTPNLAGWGVVLDGIPKAYE
jgi:hypothetical protein